MGVEVALLAASLAVGVTAQQEAKSGAAASRRAQSKIASEQRASNASEAMRERRQQVREERVRRARVLQSAENTGTSGSSGEAGAIGSLATQLSANIGTNLGKIQTADNISLFSQQQANAQGRIQDAQFQGQLAQTLFSSTIALNDAGAFDSLFKDTSVNGHASTVGMTT